MIKELEVAHHVFTAETASGGADASLKGSRPTVEDQGDLVRQTIIAGGYRLEWRRTLSVYRLCDEAGCFLHAFCPGEEVVEAQETHHQQVDSGDDQPVEGVLSPDLIYFSDHCYANTSPRLN